MFIFLEGAPVPFYIAEDGLTERNHSSYIVKFDFVDSKGKRIAWLVVIFNGEIFAGRRG